MVLSYSIIVIKLPTHLLDLAEIWSTPETPPRLPFTCNVAVNRLVQFKYHMSLVTLALLSLSPCLAAADLAHSSLALTLTLGHFKYLFPRLKEMLFLLRLCFNAVLTCELTLSTVVLNSLALLDWWICLWDWLRRLLFPCRYTGSKHTCKAIIVRVLFQPWRLTFVPKRAVNFGSQHEGLYLVFAFYLQVSIDVSSLYELSL